MQDGRASARPGEMGAEELETGARIGRYVVIDRVGVGAMGVVYGAYDPELDRKVALKLLKPGQGAKETARARLLREAKAMARLSHPNVVAVHDVGVVDNQVFLAMEFLSGGTIKNWLAEETRPWREILAVFTAAGRGLAAAHAAGLVHRDFKPDNVLLDKEGRPRVVDFGIARESGADADGDESSVAERSGEGSPAQLDAAARLRESSGSNQPFVTLTKTGALIGTPAYMAPEQFMGQRGDEKSDQFSFCVALYEALYGERPFAGDDVLSISVNVTQEQMRPLPRDRGVPAWIRRVIVRGVKLNPAQRWPSISSLIAALDDDPVAKLRRRLVVGGAVAAVVAILVGARQMVVKRRQESDREIARHVREARAASVDARANAEVARRSRQSAFDAFDTPGRSDGEALWRQVRALLPSIEGDYDRSEAALEAAGVLDRSRNDVKQLLADVEYEHLLFAEDFRLENRLAVLRERLANTDADGTHRRAFSGEGTIELRVTPPSARGLLERYERDAATGRRDLKTVGDFATNRSKPLATGSYRLTLDGPGLARVLYPFEVHRGEHVVVEVSVPRANAVPQGFAYVPPGTFWFGDADEQLRTQFLDTVPLHVRRTGAFLIAKRETTYREWIDFLKAQPAAERRLLAPHVSSITRGSLRLSEDDGGWQIEFAPTGYRYEAAVGSPIVYAGRDRNARNDWLQFPVTGISVDEAERYFAWLRETRRVPGARLCTEIEWERAARGADDRVFPHGDELGPDDANFDMTYGRVDTAYGPDMVGAHPASRSPFEVDDLAGNVLEFASSAQKEGGLVMRGGAYFFNSMTCRSTNRNAIPHSFRDVTTGLRVCGSLEGEN